jgi:hypothetical protein
MLYVADCVILLRFFFHLFCPGDFIHPSFILEYCKVFQLYTVYKEQKKTNRRSKQKRSWVQGFCFQLGSSFSKKRKFNQIYMKNFPHFFHKKLQTSANKKHCWSSFINNRVQHGWGRKDWKAQPKEHIKYSENTSPLWDAKYPHPALSGACFSCLLAHVFQPLHGSTCSL